MDSDPAEAGRDRRARRTVFLTGASAGIGLATAKLLTAQGCEVWGTSREPSRLPQFARFHPVVMDLLSRDSIRKGFDHACQEANGFDVLINNAGAGAFAPLGTMPPEIVRDQFQLLLEAPLQLICLALPHMREQNDGTIVNVTSLALQFPIPFMAPYSAAKAALSSVTQALRTELATTSIRVAEVRPGDINTRFHENTQRRPDGDDRRLRAVWETQLRVMAVSPGPERVARAILRAISAPNPPPVLVVGGLFQQWVAPLGARLLPPRLQEWALRRFYGL